MSKQASKQATNRASKPALTTPSTQTSPPTVLLNTQVHASTPKAVKNAPLQPALSALSLVVWGGLIACVVLTIASLIFETDAWQMATFTQASLKSWLSLGFIVYVSTLVGFGLWAYLLSENSAGKVMPFALLVPVFGMTTSVLLTGEAVTWWKMLAMGLILSGLGLTNIKVKYNNHNQSVKAR